MNRQDAKPPRSGGCKTWRLGVLAVFSLLGWSALIVATRCSTAPDVFVGGQVYFLDADCYARMTRVREVMDHPGRIIRHHEFENYPQGTTPHTTAPLDYLIASLALVFGNLDLAGAWISPLLAVATGVFLWWWARRLRHRGMLMLLYAVSPILVHGGALGRPDHQALLLALLAVALAAEWTLATAPSRAWEITAGCAWGAALWVSLYEPAILLALVTATQALWHRGVLRLRGRWLALGAILLLALLLEGPRLFHIDLAGLRQFAGQPVGELAPISPLAPTLYRWLGLGLLAAPFLFVWRRKTLAWAPLLVVGALVLLTIWQARWGYFLALTFLMVVPALFTFGRSWIAWIAFILCLWPVAQEWDARLFPDGPARTDRLRARYEAAALRDIADHLRSAETLPILAPWWLSPPLAYWSGQPALAGSSHESLPGILDSARFYATTDPAAGRVLLQERGVRRVVVCDPDRILETIAPLVPVTSPEAALATRLYRAPRSAPNFLQEEYANAVFKVFAAW